MNIMINNSNVKYNSNLNTQIPQKTYRKRKKKSKAMDDERVTSGM